MLLTKTKIKLLTKNTGHYILNFHVDVKLCNIESRAVFYCNDLHVRYPGLLYVLRSL